MVGDNTERNVNLFIFVVSYACDAANVLHDVLYGINLEQVVYALHHTSQTFQTHTGINVLVFHFGVVTVAVAVKLAEYQVPNLYIAVAVAANVAVRLAAAFSGPRSK